MSKTEQSRVVGLLGVGFDNDNEHIRITHSDHSRVYMGSSESHKMLQKICLDIEEAVYASGRVLSDYPPEELIKLVKELY